MKNYKQRLERLIKENEPEAPVYQIVYCTKEEARALEAERIPWQPGEPPRYIILNYGGKPASSERSDLVS